MWERRGEVRRMRCLYAVFVLRSRGEKPIAHGADKEGNHCGDGWCTDHNSRKGFGGDQVTRRRDEGRREVGQHTASQAHKEHPDEPGTLAMKQVLIHDTRVCPRVFWKAIGDSFPGVHELPSWLAGIPNIRPSTTTPDRRLPDKPAFSRLPDCRHPCCLHMIRAPDSTQAAIDGAPAGHARNVSARKGSSPQK